MSTTGSLLGDEYVDGSMSDDDSLNSSSHDVDDDLDVAFERLARMIHDSYPSPPSQSNPQHSSNSPSTPQHNRPSTSPRSTSPSSQSGSKHQAPASVSASLACLPVRHTNGAYVNYTAGSLSPASSCPPKSKKLNESEWEYVVSRLATPRSGEKVERLRKMLIAREESELRKAPEINKKTVEMSSKMAPFQQRMAAALEQSKKRREQLKQQLEEQELQSMQPVKDKKKEKNQREMDKEEREEHRRKQLEMMEKWEELRNERLKRAREALVVDELKGCSFRPQISQRSRQLAMERYAGAPLEVRAEQYELERQRKLQRLVQSVEVERASKATPAITGRSKNLQLDKDVHDRLYEHALSLQTKKNVKREQVFREYYRTEMFRPVLMGGSGHENSYALVDEETGIVYELVPVDVQEDEGMEPKEADGSPSKEPAPLPAVASQESTVDPSSSSSSSTASTTAPTTAPTTTTTTTTSSAKAENEPSSDEQPASEPASSSSAASSSTTTSAAAASSDTNSTPSTPIVDNDASTVQASSEPSQSPSVEASGVETNPS
jgi:hypothetical protein